MPRGSAEGCSPRGQPTEDGADEIRELAEARAVPTQSRRVRGEIRGVEDELGR